MAANGLSFVQTCAFVLAMVTLGQALNMTHVVFPTGKVCAELSCYHAPSGDTSIPVSRVKDLTLDIWTIRGTWESVFIFFPDGRAMMRNNLEGLGKIDGIVTNDLIQYKVNISNTDYCKESTKFACFMDYDNNKYKLATAVVVKKASETTDAAVEAAVPQRCERNMAATSNSQYVTIPQDSQSDFKFDILCDTNTEGGGWIVIQRRTNHSISFYKDWSNYKKGFGSLDADFYIGNDHIHELTANDEYELRVNLLYQGQEYFAQYDYFMVDSEYNLYTLHIGNYTGTAGDSLSYHNGMAFSTFDSDNDASVRRKCARDNHGAWWYGECYFSNLNGAWDDKVWNSLTGTQPAATTEMMIRLKN